MWLLEVEIQQGFSLSGGRPSQFYGELNLTQLLLPIVIFVLGKVCFYYAGFLWLCRFFLVAASRGYSLGAVHGLLIVAAWLFVEPGL